MRIHIRLYAIEICFNIHVRLKIHLVEYLCGLNRYKEILYIYLHVNEFYIKKPSKLIKIRSDVGIILLKIPFCKYFIFLFY